MADNLIVRPATRADAEACGRILFEGFRNLADRHGFERDFPSAEIGAAVAGGLLDTPSIEGVVAEHDGRLVGCNFVDLADPVAGIGPIAVEPAGQGHDVGRALMRAVMERVEAAGIGNIRFVQAAYNNASMGLYTRLGFQVREPMAVMQGPPIGEDLPGYEVRPAGEDDVGPCGDLCQAAHGFRRDGDVHGALRAGSAVVVLNRGRLSGYTTGIGFDGHSVAEDNESLKALIAAAQAYGGLGFILPMMNVAVLRWCLAKRLRIVLQMNLMTMGLYSPPSGAWMPSFLR